MPAVSSDEVSHTISFTHKGQTQSIKLSHADPNVPISIAGSTSISAYKAGSEKRESATPDTDEFKMLVEQMLEHYYSNAFRVTKFVQQVSGRSKYDCRPITIVRNKLIEHFKPGSIYSFGFGSNDPFIKPIYRGERVARWTSYMNLAVFTGMSLLLLAQRLFGLVFFGDLRIMKRFSQAVRLQQKEPHSPRIKYVD